MAAGFRIEQTPHAVALHAFHEQIGNPIRDVEILGAAGLVARVVAELEKFFDVGVPGFEIDTARSFALATLVHCGDGGIERFDPWHDSVAVAVCPANQRAS